MMGAIAFGLTNCIPIAIPQHLIGLEMGNAIMMESSTRKNVAMMEAIVSNLMNCIRIVK